MHSNASRLCFSDSVLSRENKGTYILVIELTKTQRIRQGKLPRSEIQKGMYLYIGRARRALQIRLKPQEKSETFFRLFCWHKKDLVPQTAAAPVICSIVYALLRS